MWSGRAAFRFQNNIRCIRLSRWLLNDSSKQSGRERSSYRLTGRRHSQTWIFSPPVKVEPQVNLRLYKFKSKASEQVYCRRVRRLLLVSRCLWLIENLLNTNNTFPARSIPLKGISHFITQHCSSDGCQNGYLPLRSISIFRKHK